MTSYGMGFHVNGQGGQRGALGAYLAQLAEHGHRPVINAVDDAALAAQAVAAGGIVVYRQTEWSAAPDYALSPRDAALTRWAGIKALIPPEIAAVKDKLYIEPNNEPDRERADWLGQFMLHLATSANADGYRIAGLSWATGNPEVEHWETPGILAYLRYVADNPAMNVISLHEYSLVADDITIGAPWLVGRYQFLFDVCDDHGIARPPVIITEAGWTYNAMPGDDAAVMAQIDWLARQYGEIPFCLWTLGSGQQWGDLPQRLSGFVDDVTAWVLANSEPPDDDTEEPPPPEPWLNAVMWQAGKDEERINFPREGALKNAIAADGYWPTSNEFDRQVAGVVYRGQKARHPQTRAERVYMARFGEWGNVWYIDSGDEDEEPPPDPGAFAFDAWPTDYKVVTQTFGNNPTYYGQFGLPGHEGIDIRAPHGTNVYAVRSGTVYLVTGDDGNYGRQVRIDHGGYKTIYAHNAETLVAVGQRVTAGQLIARADNTGNSQGSHLHLTVKRDGQPTAGWPSDIIDPSPYLLPFKPDFPGLPPSAHGLTVCDISEHQGAVDFHKMMRRGVYGCYIRGSIGGGGQDARFATYWNAIKDTPMKRGMYHLWRSDSPALVNLSNIVRVIEAYGAGDWRVALDVEPIGGGRINGDEIARFLTLFEQALGYRPLIYTGLWVLAYIDGDTSWLTRYPLWLASYWNRVPLQGEYPTLPLGAPRDNLYMHQWTSSRFDGRTWGVSSVGLDVNVAYSLERLQVKGDAPPPPAPKFDLLGYMMPTQARGPLYELRRQDGAQERVQSHVEGTTFYYVKGSGGAGGKGEWEELTYDSDWIYRGKDTSPGNGEWYALRDDVGKKWSRWVPRRMAIGETYTRNPWVVFFRKSDCAELRRGQHRTTITLTAVHANWTSPHGIQLRDVAEVEVRHADGRLFERTWFAKGYGLVGFEGEAVRGYVSELHEPGARPDQVRESGCFS